MGTLNKPGAHDCLAKLKRNPDMPYFLLLASDPLFGQIVRAWASAATVTAAHGTDKIDEAISCAEVGDKWRAANGDRLTKEEIDALADLMAFARNNCTPTMVRQLEGAALKISAKLAPLP